MVPVPYVCVIRHEFETREVGNFGMRELFRRGIQLEYRARHRSRVYTVTFVVPQGELDFSVVGPREVLAAYDRLAHREFSYIDATDH